jgi:hypothetical protein
MIAASTAAAARTEAVDARRTHAPADPVSSDDAPAPPPQGMPSWVGWALVGVGAAAVAYGAWSLLRPGGAGRMAIEQPHTASVVLRNPHRPWLASTARSAHMDALHAQKALFGSMAGHVDDEVDAFRHAYASGLLNLRIMHDRGVAPDRARRLVEAIGRAHELDGIDNGLRLSSRMDDLNNLAGLRIVGNGRLPGGSWIGEQALQQRVLDALRGGQLVTIERTAELGERLVATTGATLPRIR